MSGNTPEQKANLPQAVETENKTEEGVGEKKVEDKWSAAIGLSGIVALLGALEFYLCISSQIWDDKFMNVIGGYDKGSLLGVLAIVGIIAAMVGAYGIVLCAYCKKPGIASRLRYMIYGYIGWGGGTVCMLIASAVLTFSGSKQLEVMFKVVIIYALIPLFVHWFIVCSVGLFAKLFSNFFHEVILTFLTS